MAVVFPAPAGAIASCSRALDVHICQTSEACPRSSAVRFAASSSKARFTADSPTTVLISTHNMHELESLADHVGVLRDGRLVAQMPREELHRRVRSYQLEVPDGWEAPRELQPTGLRRSSAGRDVRCTLVGEEREVTRHLAAAGARVRQVSKLPLEDAALAFLPEDPS